MSSLQTNKFEFTITVLSVCTASETGGGLVVQFPLTYAGAALAPPLSLLGSACSLVSRVCVRCWNFGLGVRFSQGSHFAGVNCFNSAMNSCYQFINYIYFNV